MDLNTASNEQLEVYRATVAKTMSIDPLMLDFIWMNDPETGLRNRVLYAKRGAAEVLRHELKVSVTSLVMSEQAGLVTFIATGNIPSGRQEMAVGSAYIEGLRGDKKAHGVMTASTRAVRRLTLQFVTGGVLDETEVQAQSDLQSPSAAAGAQLSGSPVVVPTLPQSAPSAAPGKDITSPNEPLTEFEKAVVLPMAKELGYATPEEFSAAQQALRDEAKAQLMAKPPSEPTTPQGTTFEQQPPAKVKRTRKARNTVSIASPGQQTEMPTGQIDATGTITPLQVSTPAAVVPVSVPPVAAVEKAQPVVAQLPAPPLSTPQTPTSLAAQISPEKAIEFKTRLRVYANDVLPKGGLLPKDGVGGVTMQLRLFAQIHTGSTDTNTLSLTQWEDLFEFLDDYTAKNGPQGLAKYVSQAIEARK